MARWKPSAVTGLLALGLGMSVAPAAMGASASTRGGFQLEEATIAEIQPAIRRGRLTTTEIVEGYLERIKAYNGTCVNEPEGILGPISTIPNAEKLNALITLNLRPETREKWGFDERKARSQTDDADDDPDMPDALEVAAQLDAKFKRTRHLAGPLHGVVIAIKDQYDTVDMRTTSGADAFWANDRPPDDATFIARLREAGAIILAKANMGEYAAGGMTGTRSMFFDPSLVPHTGAGQPSIRNLGDRGGDSGDARFNYDMYIRERGDAEIKSLTDLIEKANHWTDAAIPNRKASLESANDDMTLSTGSALQDRFTMQTVVFQCFALMELDAVVYPTGNIPPPILTSPELPSVNDRPSSIWTQINRSGFPAMTVPAGFTTRVYDAGPDRKILPPKAAALPVGIDFLGLPFSEPTLFEIGAAYEAATRHRTPPPGFGPLEGRTSKPDGRGATAR